MLSAGELQDRVIDKLFEDWGDQMGGRRGMRLRVKALPRGSRVTVSVKSPRRKYALEFLDALITEHEMTWKSPGQLIRMLVNTVALGGNLLMNVGPTARGTFDQRALDALQVYADWLRLHSRAIYGCTQSEFTAPPDVRYTQNGDRLYVHIYAWPFRHLHLPGLAGKVEYAHNAKDQAKPGSDQKIG